MPQLGESVSEGTVVRWLKRVGDNVAVDEPLFEVASDKVNMEIPSLGAGRLAEILVPEGETVEVGTAVARLESTADVATPRAAVELTANPSPAPAVRNPQPHSNNGAALLSPVVRRLVREYHLDVSPISGTGRNGRVTRNDVLAFVAARSARTPAPVTLAAPPPAAAAPVAMPPAFAAMRPASAAVPPVRAVAAPATLRAKIAANVLASKQQVADAFSVMEVDMENVSAVRTRRKDAFKQQEATSLTYLPFIIHATIEALSAYPAVNGRFEGSALMYNDAVNVGIAVDLDERGLVVPVIRNADALNVTGIARAIATLSSAVRAGSAKPDDLTGSTFTISNNGSFGTLMSGAIINQPNVAILSTDVVEERVVPFNGMIAIRRRMYLCMTWDHRAFDGSTAAKFLAHVKRQLEDRDWARQL